MSAQRSTGMTRQAVWPTEDGPWLLRLHWRKSSGEGGPIGFELWPLPGRDPGPVTTTLLRQIPLAAISRRLSEPLVADALVEPPGAASPRDRAKGQARAPGRPIKLDDEHYREIARRYSLAVDNNRPPRAVIQQAYGASGSTVSRWIARARELGFLPPTRRNESKAAPPTRRQRENAQ